MSDRPPDQPVAGRCAIARRLRGSLRLRLGVAAGVQGLALLGLVGVASWASAGTGRAVAWSGAAEAYTHAAQRLTGTLTALEAHALRRAHPLSGVPPTACGPDLLALRGAQEELLQASRSQLDVGQDEQDAESEGSDLRRAEELVAQAAQLGQRFAALEGMPPGAPATRLLASDLARRAAGLTQLVSREAEREQREELEQRAAIQAVAAQLRHTSLLLGLVGLLLWALTSSLLIRSVIAPLDALHGATRQLAAGELGFQVAAPGPDELGDLARSFNHMSATLAEQRDALARAHQRLLLAREAGMAEVANCVLHNVGNVLNSLCASVTRGAQVIEGMDTRSLVAASELLQGRNGDLAAFLAQDQRGKQLPRLFQLLGGRLSAQREEAAGEVERLRRLIEQVTRIVAAQQAYARGNHTVETVHLDRLIEDAIQIGVGSASERGIEVARRIGPHLPLRLDGHKLLQVLVNLFKNAKESLRTRPEPRKIEVESREEDGALVLSVIDNGAGIEPSVLPHLFQHGYTTKPGGSGFGLHSAALAMEDMGGTISAASPGAGQGACFTLRVPLAPAGQAESQEAAAPRLPART